MVTWEDELLLLREHIEKYLDIIELYISSIDLNEMREDCERIVCNDRLMLEPRTVLMLIPNFENYPKNIVAGVWENLEDAYEVCQKEHAILIGDAEYDKRCQKLNDLERADSDDQYYDHYLYRTS